MNRSRLFVGAGAMTALIVWLLAVSAHRPASAQGGLLCDVGPADYRRCCKESYRRAPELGLRARAEDIEACLKSDVREDPAAERRESDRDGVEDRRPAEPAPPAPPPPVVLRNTGASPIRRITCATEPCEKGCGADEMAVSAFCQIGSFPTLTPDGAVRCAATGSASELPVALFCAKR